MEKDKKLYSTLPELMARTDPKMTQRYLAEQLGVSASVINRLYNGQPVTFKLNPEVLEKICNYFDCPLADLLTMKSPNDI
ncbi:helix-turn-helix domain-containing protein [Gloeothece verrucosa]|uniref:Transcriptional regulator, XRE family n=1 Tax=Gloeothece verrucosa (strain PCC 7822) TaxID=497965 RepID=E0ULC2_GLOV7|nr:helix-turn-helix transcriptional regulator [Gloeothece verrucosa]ADN17752.1 transcriptional regulator, XRE family [Gloeothece verrucosa PCC 7822]